MDKKCKFVYKNSFDCSIEKRTEKDIVERNLFKKATHIISMLDQYTDIHNCYVFVEGIKYEIFGRDICRHLTKLYVRVFAADSSSPSKQ